MTNVQQFPEGLKRDKFPNLKWIHSSFAGKHSVQTSCKCCLCVDELCEIYCERNLITGAGHILQGFFEPGKVKIRLYYQCYSFQLTLDYAFICAVAQYVVICVQPLDCIFTRSAHTWSVPLAESAIGRIIEHEKFFLEVFVHQRAGKFPCW